MLHIITLFDAFFFSLLFILVFLARKAWMTFYTYFEAKYAISSLLQGLILHIYAYMMISINILKYFIDNSLLLITQKGLSHAIYTGTCIGRYYSPSFDE